MTTRRPPSAALSPKKSRSTRTSSTAITCRITPRSLTLRRMSFSRGSDSASIAARDRVIGRHVEALRAADGGAG
jgi:hypothetical protein